MSDVKFLVLGVLLAVICALAGTNLIVSVSTHNMLVEVRHD